MRTSILSPPTILGEESNVQKLPVKYISYREIKIKTCFPLVPSKSSPSCITYSYRLVLAVDLKPVLDSLVVSSSCRLRPQCMKNLSIHQD